MIIIGESRRGRRAGTRGFDDCPKDTQTSDCRRRYIDREKFESFTDADIERMIDEDLDPALQAPLRIFDPHP